MKLVKIDSYLLLVDEEAEIKPDDYIIHDTVEGVIEANDEWHPRGEKDDYWNKIIAYYPLTKEAKELDLPLLPNPFEENIEILWADFNKNHNRNCPLSKEQFVRAINYKAAQSKQFTLEDMKKAFEAGANWQEGGTILYPDIHGFIQSLSTQQLPKEFIPEYYTHKYDYGIGRSCMPIKHLKIITNSKGKEELVGTYKY